MILVTGKGSSGSWKIRGEQLGGAIGAHVQPMADARTIQAADLVIVVKRMPPALWAAIKKSGKPWVWDLVDHFPQPNDWGREQAVKYLRKLLAEHQPAAVVFPTRAMQVDADWSGPQTVLCHHARPDQSINPIRPKVKTVGYEGSHRYIEGLRLKEICSEFGFSFVSHKDISQHLSASLPIADVDVLLALRAPPWNTYTSRHWKSNVKLANAHATGTPIILPREDGYVETASGRELWADEELQLRLHLDALRDSYDFRQWINRRFLTMDWSLERIAREYREWLDTL